MYVKHTVEPTLIDSYSHYTDFDSTNFRISTLKGKPRYNNAFKLGLRKYAAEFLDPMVEKEASKPATENRLCSVW